MGTVPGARVKNDGCHLGKDGVLSLELLSKCFGNKLLDFEHVARKLVREKGCAVKYSKKKAAYKVNGEKEILGVKLLFVEYTPGGKYQARNRCRWPHSLPCKIRPLGGGEPAAPWWPVVVLSFTDKVARDYKVSMEMDCHEHAEEEAANMDEVMVDYDEERDEEELQPKTAVASASSSAAVRAGTCVACVHVVCKEQVKDDVPEAWPIPLHSRM
jgi:hypothetical protein